MTRREEIVQATLALLASTPLDRVTTRQIAAHVGLTQPALFRHFPNRDAIVLAALAWTTAELEAAAAAVLVVPLPPLGRAGQLARALGAHAERFPGLPRLLFGDVSGGEQPELREALSRLVRLQRAVVTTLVREAQGRGEAPAGVDAERAAALFVAGMQGVLVDWLLGGARGTPDVAGFADLWQRGVEAGQPAGVERGAILVDHLDLDATARLAAGVDPLPEVLEAAERIAPGGTLRISAPFPPAPLGALLSARGWSVSVTPSATGFLLSAKRPA